MIHHLHEPIPHCRRDGLLGSRVQLGLSHRRIAAGGLLGHGQANAAFASLGHEGEPNLASGFLHQTTLEQPLEDGYSVRAADMPGADDLVMRIYPAMAQTERELISKHIR
jgi:hypothetical protein